MGNRMIEGYWWVGQVLFYTGLFGIGICFSWLLTKIWPLSPEEDE